VPIGWVAVGDPARIFPPGQHEQIWAIQESLDFPGTVYGVARDTPGTERMSRQAAWYGSTSAAASSKDGEMTGSGPRVPGAGGCYPRR
jgi:gamma-carbonic anhydrase